jgi:hypothetical protein
MQYGKQLVWFSDSRNTYYKTAFTMFKCLKCVLDTDLFNEQSFLFAVFYTIKITNLYTMLKTCI